MSKANAKEWHQEQKQIAERAEQMSKEEIHLWYAANKRDCNYPYANTFKDAGHIEVSSLIERAYKLLEEAYYLYENEKR